jgi:hypothetical protein
MAGFVKERYRVALAYNAYTDELVSINHTKYALKHDVRHDDRCGSRQLARKMDRCR